MSEDVKQSAERAKEHIARMMKMHGAAAELLKVDGTREAGYGAAMMACGMEIAFAKGLLSGAADLLSDLTDDYIALVEPAMREEHGEEGALDATYALPEVVSMRNFVEFVREYLAAEHIAPAKSEGKVEDGAE